MLMIPIQPQLFLFLNLLSIRHFKYRATINIIWIGCCIFINESWFKLLNEQNEKWSNVCEEISNDWANFYKKLVENMEET